MLARHFQTKTLPDLVLVTKLYVTANSPYSKVIAPLGKVRARPTDVHTTFSNSLRQTAPSVKRHAS